MTWEQLETSKFGRDLTSYLRTSRTTSKFKTQTGLKDATISSHIGILNRMFRQAEIDNLITSTSVKGVPALAQAGTTIGKPNSDAYAVFTDEMMHQLFEHMRNKIQSTTHAGFKRTHIQTYAQARIWADTGIRPFSICPLTFEMFHDEGDMVILDRQEKNKRYNAQGGSVTKEALDDLRQLYLSEGTNVNQHKDLPLFHHPRCGNSYNGKDVEPYSQILRSHDNVRRCIRELGWFDMTDRLGRKYRNYSIRKWHINKSIEQGELGESIAKRVGHTYAVLEKFYLDKYAKQKQKADIWNRRFDIVKPTEKDGGTD